MIFDTDIIIFAQRGNIKAANLIKSPLEKYISTQTYLELFQCARNKRDHEIIKDFLSKFDFEILPLTPAIGHRAIVYVEEYTLSHGIESGDAIVAATAVEKNLILATSNQKHFKCISDLKLKIFKP